MNSQTKMLKSKIAIVQLRRSIQLFNIGDYISALTLAGAANEIFGELAIERWGYNSTDADKSFWDSVAELYKKEKISRGRVIQVNNKIKNAVKHHNSSDDLEVKADFEFDAQCHIDSAISNYWIAFDEPIKDRIIVKYTKLKW